MLYRRSPCDYFDEINPRKGHQYLGLTISSFNIKKAMYIEFKDDLN